MLRAIAGRDCASLRLEARAHAGEDEASKGVVPGRVSVGVVRSIAGWSIANHERRLAIEHIVDAQPQLKSLAHLERRGSIEIILRLQSRIIRTDLVGEVEFRIERGEFYLPDAAPLKRQLQAVWSAPADPGRVFPARLHQTGRAEQARAIVRGRKSAIVHDPAQDVGAAKLEACRPEATQRQCIIGPAIDPADLQATKVRLAIIDISVAG